MPYLVIRELGAERTLDITDTEISIGRSRQNQVKLLTDQASREHTRILKTPLGYKVVDADSSNGTYVNGQRITEKDLADGDSIGVGHATIIFREGDTGDEAYLIKSGLVEISRLAGSKDVVVAEAGNGSIIGEMALIDSLPRMATARAKTTTQLTVIPREALTGRLDRLEKFDPVLRRMMDMFVQRMRDHPIIEQ